MSEDYEFIYYASPEYVNQLYAACFGEKGQKTVTRESGSGINATTKVGLSKLLTMVADLSAGGTVDYQRKKTESLQIVEGILDQAHAVLKFLKGKNAIPPFEERGEGVFWYSLPTRLVQRKVGNKLFINVACDLPDIFLRGLTSIDNWCGPSSLNNLIIASALEPIETFGLVLPLQIKEVEQRIQMDVQFIIIASPKTWK